MPRTKGRGPVLKPERYVVENRGYQTPCWVWSLATNNRGYGRVRIAGRERLAHVAMYEEAIGPVPTGHELDHLCRIPSCVNPEHLEAVTHAENMQRGNPARFTREDVRRMRSLAGLGTSYPGIAEMFETDRSTVRKIVVRERWANVR